MRLGLHTGECEIIGEGIGGMAVHIAARIGALAEAGEILVSGTTYGTIVGSGLDFDYRGEHRLRGVPGRWPRVRAQRLTAPTARTSAASPSTWAGHESRRRRPGSACAGRSPSSSRRSAAVSAATSPAS